MCRVPVKGLLAYGVLLWLFFHAWVVGLEEPELRAKRPALDPAAHALASRTTPESLVTPAAVRGLPLRREWHAEPDPRCASGVSGRRYQARLPRVLKLDLLGQ